MGDKSHCGNSNSRILDSVSDSPRCCVVWEATAKDLHLAVSAAAAAALEAISILNPFSLLSSLSASPYNNNNNNCIQRRYSRFFTISSQHRKLSPTRTLKWPGHNRVQIMCNTSSAYRVQHVVLRATWYEGTAQLLSLTELKSHLFELYFVG